MTLTVHHELADRLTNDVETVSASAVASPLRHLDPTRDGAKAQAESRNREVHLPPISVYRWWARRTEAVNGAIIDAVNRDRPGQLLVADVFAGGGVIPLAAVMRNHRVYAQDLNPWATVGLAAMLGLPAPDALREAAAVLQLRMEREIKAAYGTTMSDGETGELAHTFRVATGECTSCGERSRMFPHALVSLTVRRERKGTEAFLACPRGHLFKADYRNTVACTQCETATDPTANYTARRRVICSHCGHVDQLEDRAATWQWEVVLVERTRRGVRELALPTPTEQALGADERWAPTRTLGTIPEGQETRVLRRHGFESWQQLYPNRQRYLLERMLDAAQRISDDPAVVHSVSMAIIGSAEMAGYLSRWDRYYLKSYESMAGHRFNLTTFAVEPNVWGTPNSGRGTVLRRLAQLVKASTWLLEKTGLPLVVESSVASTVNSSQVDEPLSWDVRVVEGSSERILLPNGLVDLALTDPPYHDDVQYAELSLPLRAWAMLASDSLVGEAVVNQATGQLKDEGAYEDLLARIFAETRRTLRSDGHLIFSYANRSPKAWGALFSALQRAGLRAVGCEIIHSENETDHAKRGVRACTLDLILDLTHSDTPVIATHAPQANDTSDEVDFLRMVAEYFLRVGALDEGWREEMSQRLELSAFLDAGPRTRPTS